ncbi:restriction endonuclease [Blastopirellula sp. JC732]|uniref:Restriction endonuclease n=1 Tax=Blastopirellula sediminis TaxID=2894196 RepID=A0A9X1SF92_9BACT|nr:restriction endonuclease [Blastopirellula sediminis]MCC9628048.1 restriction endonuclease [Blastopirellula sediminis]
MSGNATESEIAALDARVGDLSRRLHAVNEAIYSANSKRGVRWCIVSYYSVALFANGLVDRLVFWRSGVLLMVSICVGALGFIAADIITSHRTFSIVSGIACTVFGLLAGYFLLFCVNMQEARRRHEDLSLEFQRLNDQIKTLRNESKDLTSEMMQVQAHRQLLVEHLEDQRKLRSMEYRRNQLFQRNWRAMRSVEFEEYLEEVLQLLGYTIETTAITGDQGVDLIAVKQGIRIAIQVKGYLNSVSNSAIQEAFAGMAHYKCDCCAAITNSRFTNGAIQLAQSTGCILVHEDNFRDFVMGQLDLVQMARGRYGK